VNLTQLKQRVGWRTGIAVGDEALTGFINEALETIAAERDWPWLQRTTTVNLVNGQGTYGVPADYVRTRSLGDVDGQVPIVAERDLENDAGELVATIEGDQLLVRPVPTAARALTHRYQAAPAELVNGTDEPELPYAFGGAVVAYAAYLVYERAGADTKAERALGDYGRWMRRLQNERRFAGPRRIRVREGSPL
jgi:hypothetical protein